MNLVKQRVKLLVEPSSENAFATMIADAEARSTIRQVLLFGLNLGNSDEQKNHLIPWSSG